MKLSGFDEFRMFYELLMIWVMIVFCEFICFCNYCNFPMIFVVDVICKGWMFGDGMMNGLIYLFCGFCMFFCSFYIYGWKLEEMEDGKLVYFMMEFYERFFIFENKILFL